MCSRAGVPLRVLHHGPRTRPADLPLLARQASFHRTDQTGARSALAHGRGPVRRAPGLPAGRRLLLQDRRPRRHRPRPDRADRAGVGLPPRVLPPGPGEFAYRNHLDLTPLRIEARRANRTPGQPPPTAAGRQRALVPFGGGIDSIVVVERVRRLADVALFVVSRPADRFDAIEAPAAVTGLPIVRAEREIDPQLLRSAELGFLNGHVPVTGILSAIAVLAAELEDRDAVVMSNEWSASIPTLQYQGRPVNHQYSKGAEFEAAFRAVLAASPGPLP